MNFDVFDRRMRDWETKEDDCIPPNVFAVARLDGRSFTRLTKDICQFDAPFDVRFRDMMIATTQSLMTCGFDIRYGYCQSDEISLLFDPNERHFGRKRRKYISKLAGEASARFSLLLGQVGTFDCRLTELTTEELVVDYFQWRKEDAARNALNACCYWTLRKNGVSSRHATNRLEGISSFEKQSLLKDLGIDFADVPTWQTRGIGLHWETYRKLSHNPITHQAGTTERRRIRIEYELPTRNDYSRFVRKHFGELSGLQRTIQLA